MMKSLCLLALTLLLGACKTEPEIETRSVIPEVFERPSFANHSPLIGAIEIGFVAGGREKDSDGCPDISAEKFKSILEATLFWTDLLSNGEGNLTLHATLIKLVSPNAHLLGTYEAHTRYVVSDEEGVSVFNEVIVTTFEPSFGLDALKVDRVRNAKAIALKDNILKFLDELDAQSRSDPDRFGDAKPLTGS